MQRDELDKINKLLNEAFIPAVDKFEKAILYCVNSEEKLGTQALILLYSAIDWVGWLNSDHSDVGVNFRAWVKEFMLPGSDLPCNEDDIYGARCSVLHTYTAESNLSRQGTARKLVYAWANDDPAKIQLAIRRLGKGEEMLAVQGEKLLDAYRNGLHRFRKKMLADTKCLNRVYAKASSLLRDTTQNETELLKYGYLPLYAALLSDGPPITPPPR